MPIQFSQRHIGPNKKQIKEMLSYLRFSSFDEFIDKAIETSVSNTGFSKSKEENEHNKTHLNKLIPDDAKSVTYNGITASRNKNCIVSIRIK